MLYEIFNNHPQISTDSRKVSSGSLFFALRGDNFDGNRYAEQALADGAAFAIVDDPTLVGERYIVVDDVLRTLQELAAEHRQLLGLPIIAITGSNGKTTTKEMLIKVLETRFRVGATVGNLNNHIGVPLTLLSFDATTEIGIVEMGANHVGEIAALCAIIKPNAGLITNIGLAHLDGFGGAAGIRTAKGELYDYLVANGGTAIYNTADAVLAEMIAQRSDFEKTTVENFHQLQSLDDSDRPHCLGYDPTSMALELSIYGQYNQLNAQAAFAVGRYFGVDDAKSRKALAEYIPANNRSQIIVTEHNTLYMDAYNANPSSMRAAIENFVSLGVKHKVLILGEMRELGEYSPREHADLVMLVDRLPCSFDEVLLVGNDFRNCPLEYGFRHFENAAELGEYLKKKKFTSRHILVKGSRGVALEAVVEHL